MKSKSKIVILIVVSFAILLFCIAFGSVHVPIMHVLHILAHTLFDVPLPEHVAPTNVAIVWNLRLPRVLLAFLAGSALSVSGAVMQSVLRNPLASSFTLGVSSGASLGASFVIFMGVTLPFVAMLTLPILGFIFGLGTIILVMAIVSRLDSRMENQTIILTGMVLSLFVNAITTLIFTFFRESASRMIFWQMGSFSMRDWHTVLILAPIVLVGIVFIMRYKTELDVMTFGEEQAQTMGVNIKRVKWTLLIAAAAITGSTIAFVGVIGFIDLVVPHIIRKIFGSAHKYVIPMSALLGGAFMALCDLAARIVVAPLELPVGAVTALIGAPFFAYIYFSKRKQ